MRIKCDWYFAVFLYRHDRGFIYNVPLPIKAIFNCPVSLKVFVTLYIHANFDLAMSS